MERGSDGDISEVCRESLTEILLSTMSIFGRLVTISMLRDRSTGVYAHPQSAKYGAAEVDRALRVMHREVFLVWLGLSLEQQERDLGIWLGGIGQCDQKQPPLHEIARDLKVLLPAQFIEAEEKLMMSDFRMLMVLTGRNTNVVKRETPRPRPTSRLSWLMR